MPPNFEKPKMDDLKKAQKEIESWRTAVYAFFVGLGGPDCTEAMQMADRRMSDEEAQFRLSESGTKLALILYRLKEAKDKKK